MGFTAVTSTCGLLLGVGIAGDRPALIGLGVAGVTVAVLLSTRILTRGRAPKAQGPEGSGPTSAIATTPAIGAEDQSRAQILASMSDGIVIVDADGTILYANPSAESFLGRGHPLPEMLFRTGTAEFVVRHPQRRNLAAVASRLDENRWLIELQDVTELRRVEAMRRDFVADVSHELKTPVAGILAAAETLEVSVKEDPGNVARFASSLLRESRRLHRLVEDLLDLARLEDESGSGQVMSLSSIVRAEIDRIEMLAEEKGLALTAEVAESIDLSGDAEDLSLMVRNLLDNAVRYTEIGEISVKLERENGEAVLEVDDTGVGIPASEIPRIFERFYRVDKARSRETGGTGLGLSIVKHAVDRLGGSVEARSELGKGSKFVVRLPIS